ncbi:beta strand repeat-containing protein, partial [Novipirellula rosea]|uniref:beta strand repeat-containing protein n=1 Tax=Novipirellula rosea TaxID=1031540 RepID=UPI0031E70323
MSLRRNSNLSGTSLNRLSRVEKLRQRVRRWSDRLESRRQSWAEKRAARLERFREAFRGAWLAKIGLGLMAIVRMITDPPFIVRIEKRPAVPYTAMLPWLFSFERKTDRRRRPRFASTQQSGVTVETLERRELLAADITGIGESEDFADIAGVTADTASTNDLTPTITGTATAGSTVYVDGIETFVDVGNDASDGNASDGLGSWTFTPSAQITHGQTFSVMEGATGATSFTADDAVTISYEMSVNVASGESLQHAIDNIPSGGTIHLAANFDHDGSRVTIDAKDLTIQGNGATIDGGLDIEGGAKVVVNDLTISGITGDSSAKWSSLSSNGATGEKIVVGLRGTGSELTADNLNIDQVGLVDANLVGFGVQPGGEVTLINSDIKLVGGNVFGFYLQSGNTSVSIDNVDFDFTPQRQRAGFNNQNGVMFGFQASSGTVLPTINAQNYTQAFHNDNPLPDSGVERRLYKLQGYYTGADLSEAQLKSYLASQMVAGEQARYFYTGGSWVNEYAPSVTNTADDSVYATIQSAIDNAAPGDTITVAAGTFTENLVISKPVIIVGATDVEGNATTKIQASSGNVVNVTGTSFPTDAVVAISNVNLDGQSTANIGLRIDGNANVSSVSLDNGSVENFRSQGFYVGASAYSGSDPSASAIVNSVTLTNLDFANNGINGSGGQGDIQFYGYNNNATLSNLNLVGNRIGNAGAQLGIQFRGVGQQDGTGVVASGTIDLTNIDVSGKYRTQMIGIQRYSDVSGLSFSGIELGGGTSEITGGWGSALRFDGVGTGTVATPKTVNLGNTLFRGVGGSGVNDLEFAPDNAFAFLRADATSTRWRIEGTDTPATSLTTDQAFAVENRILHFVDELHSTHGETFGAFKGFAEILDGQAFVTSTSSGGVGTGSIRRAAQAVDAEGTVHVAAGTYVENVTIDQSVTLLSSGGREVTTIEGVPSGSELGAIHIKPAIDNVTIGAIDHGFTVVGIDGNGVVEKAAVYIQGSNSDITIQGNDIVANGDAGLMSEYAGAIVNTLVDSNIFSGQTFAGTQPSGIGFGTQFNVGNNVPRQLVVMGNGGGGSQASNNIIFSNNQVTGVAGGVSSDDGVSEQGNTLVTIDAVDSTISGNTFTGFTNRYATAIRARGQNTDITNNTLDHTGAGSSRGIFIDNHGTPGTYSGNVLTGGEDAELIYALTPGDDIVSGNAGDDVLGGDAGNDTIDGGDGKDTVAYPGLRADYTLAVTTDSTGRVTAFTGISSLATGSDTLSNIEVLNFATDDVTLDLTQPIQVFSGSDLVGTFATVGEAITAAPEGSTLRIPAGTYDIDSQVVVANGITLIGSGAGVTVLQPTFSTGSSGDSRGWFLVNNGVNFSASELTFDGNGQKVWQAIRHLGSGTFDSVEFKDIQFDADGPSYAGTAIAAFGSNVNVDVLNSSFVDIGRIGTLYFGASVTGRFEGNTYTGKGAGDHLDYALDISAGAVVSVVGNTITGNLGVASSDGSTSAGILITTYFGAGTTANITNNTLTGNTTAVAVGYDSNDSSNVTIFDNDLSGNSDGVTSTNPVVNAAGNWWGTADESLIAASGSVDFSTYLTSGLDTATGTLGFQGDFSELNVTALGSQAGSSSRIDEAIVLVTDGGTLNLGSGTFAGASVTKPVTIIGVGAGQTIVEPTSGSGLHLVGDLGTDATVRIESITFQNAPTSGVRFDDNAILGTLEIVNSEFIANQYNGLQIGGNYSPVDLDNVVITGSTFTGNGQPSGSSGDGDILFFMYGGNATLANLTITGQDRGTGAAENAIQFRNDTTPIGNVSLANITISGVYEKQTIGIFNYDNIDGLSIHGLNIASDSLNWDTAINIDGVGGNVDLTNTSRFSGINVSLAGPDDVVALQGDSGANQLTGGSENNMLRGYGGDDTLVGGGGTNAARYNGNRANYTITQTGSRSFTVVDNAGSDGTDTLSGIDLLIFADGVATPPSNITLNQLSVIENAAAAIIADVTVSDTDAGETHTVTVDDARFEVISGQLKLKPGQSLNFETEPSVTLQLTATGDIDGLSLTKSFTIAVLNQNDAPTTTGISDVTASEDTAFSLATASAFADQDVPNSFTYSATGLPASLSINSTTGVISGLPTNADVNVYNVIVTATDSAAASVSASFQLTVQNVNNPPTSTAIANQTAAQGSLFNLTVTNNFSDIDAGDELTLTATRTSGAALPAWLNFSDGVFSGTPGAADVTSTPLQIRVTATDGDNATTQRTFSLVVQDVNDAPTSDPIDDQSAVEDAAFSFDAKVAGKFADADAGDTLTFTATKDNGTALPAWITIDPASGVLSGTPRNGDVGTVAVKVTATDPSGASSSQTFDVTVLNTNDAPVAVGAIPAQTASQGASITPINASAYFSDPDVGDVLNYTLSGAPTGLSINATSGVISGTPTQSGSFTLSVTATDNASSPLSLTRSFSMTVASANQAPTVTGTLADVSIKVNRTSAQTKTVAAATVFSDANGDTLTYSLGGSSPTYASINASTGVVTLSPAAGRDDRGTATVTVNATDGQSPAVSTTFDVEVKYVFGAIGSDGFLVGSTGFFDADDDRVFDFGVEVSAPTDSGGGFELDVFDALIQYYEDNGGAVTEGEPVDYDDFDDFFGFDDEPASNAAFGVTGGTDLSTNRAVVGELFTPFSFRDVYLVSPLTTLLVGKTGDSFTQFSQTELKSTLSILSLADPTADLTGYNSITEVASSTLGTDESKDAVRVATVTSQIRNTTRLIADAFDAVDNVATTPAYTLNELVNDAYDVVRQVIAGRVATTGSFSFTSAADIGAVIDAMEARTNITLGEVDNSTSGDQQSNLTTVVTNVTGDIQSAMNSLIASTPEVPVSPVSGANQSGDVRIDFLNYTAAAQIFAEDTGAAFDQAADFGPAVVATNATNLNPSVESQFSLLGSVVGSKGTAGNDTLVGLDLQMVGSEVVNKVDVIDGLGGNDKLTGKEGNDILIGGAGNDTVDYSIDGGPNGVTVNLSTGIATDTYDDTDSLDGIENVIGTTSADTITGDAAENVITLPGTSLGDVVDGGAGIDRVVFSDLSSTTPITTNAAGQIVVGSGTVTTLTNIEAIEFSDGKVFYPPTALTFSTAASYPEGSTSFGIATVTDAGDAGQSGNVVATHTYSVDDSRFQFSGNALVLAPAATLDFEAGATVNLNVTATDANGLSITKPLTFAVTNVNEAPSVVGSGLADLNATQGTTVDVQLSSAFSDPDIGDTLAFTLSGNPAWLSIVDGKLSGVPGNSDVTTAPVTVTLTATDALGLSVSDTFNLTVANVNDAPTAQTIPAQSVPQLTPFNLTLSNFFSDIDAGDTLTYTATLSDGNSLPGWLSVVGNELKGTPIAQADVGPITVKVTATDNGTPTNRATFTTFVLTVTDVNEAPTTSGIVNQTFDEDESVTLNAATVGDFADPDGDTLSFSATGLPTGLSINTAGLITGNVGNDFVGNHTVTVTASDGNVTTPLTTSTTFVITIENVNDAPTSIAISSPQNATEDTEYSFDAKAAGSFADVDAGDTLTFSATGLPSSLSIAPATGLITGTPTNADVGSHIVTVTATDGSNTPTARSFTLAIANVNDAPTFNGPIGTQAVTKGEAYSLNLAAFFNDIDSGDPLTYTVVGTLPDGLSLSGSEVSGTPSSTATASSVTFTATDGSSSSVSSNAVTFTVQTKTTGTAGVDTLTGTEAANELQGLAGDDSIDGLGDIDTAIFSGLRSSYTLAPSSTTGKLQVSGPDGTDTLVNVEILKFLLDNKIVRIVGAGSEHATNSAAIAAANVGDEIYNVTTGATFRLTAVKQVTIANGTLLQDAIDAVPAGYTVVTEADYSSTENISSTGKELTLKLQGEITGNFSVDDDCDIIAIGDLTLGKSDGSVSLGGGLDVGSYHVTLNDSDDVLLGTHTTLAGGMLTAANGVSLAEGDLISGYGTVAAAVSANTGSIHANMSGQTLTIGNGESNTGFAINISTSGSNNGGTIVVEQGATLRVKDANGISLGKTTTVNGTLRVENTSNVSQALTLGANGITPAKLTGTGTIDGSLVLAGGTLNPGSGTTPLTVTGNLTAQASTVSTLQATITSPTNLNQVKVNGTVNLSGGTLNLALATTAASLAAGQRFILIDNAGTTATTVGTVSLGGVTLSSDLSLQLTGVGGVKDAHFTFAGGNGNDVAITIDGEFKPTNYITVDGVDNKLKLVKVGNELQTQDEAGNVIDSRSLSSVTDLVLEGGTGDDTFTIDPAAIPAGGLTVDGGTGGDDALVVTNTGGMDTKITFDAHSGIGKDFGGNIQIGPNATNKITFKNLEPVDIGSSGNVEFVLNAGASATVTQISAGNYNITANPGGPGFESTNFSLGSGNSLTINGNTGAESVTFSGAISLPGALNIGMDAGSNGADSVIINGALTVAGDVTINAETVALNAALTTTAGGTLDITADTVTAAVGGNITADDDVTVVATGAVSLKNITMTTANPVTLIAGNTTSLGALDVAVVNGATTLDTGAKTGITVTSTDAPSVSAVNGGATGNVSITGNSTGTMVVNSLTNAAPGGTITVTNPGSLSVDVGGGITSNGGVVNLSATNTTIARAVSVNKAIQSSGGNINISATGNINVTNTVDAGAGKISLNADSDGNTTDSVPSGNFDLTGGSVAKLISTNPDNDAIVITAADMTISSTITSTGRTVLRNSTANRAIILGSPSGSGLKLENSELLQISAGSLEIGRNDTSPVNRASGPITVFDTIVPSGVATLILKTASTISDATSNAITVPNLKLVAGGNVTLDGANEVNNLVAVVSGSGNTFTFNDVGATPVGGGTAAGLTLPAGGIDTTLGITTDGGAVTLKSTAITVNSAIFSQGSTNTNVDGVITLIQDNLDLNASVNADSADINIRSLNATTAIHLGAADAAGVLGLEQDDLNNVTTNGVLRIGASGSLSVGVSTVPAHTGNINLAGPVTQDSTGFTTLSLITQGAIADSSANATVDITVTNLAIQAGKGIGATNDINVTVDKLAAHNDIGVATGNIHINNLGNLIVDSVDGVDGIINAGGNGTVTVNVGTGSGSGTLNVNQSINSTNGNITLTSAGNATFELAGDINSGGGNVKVDSGGFLLMKDNGTSNATVFDAGTGTGAGTIDLDAIGDITLGGLVTGNTTDNAVTIDTGAGVIDAGNFAIDSIAAAGGVKINAVTGIGHGNAIETNINRLWATNSTSGDIKIVESNGLIINQIDQDGGAVDVVTTNGSITVAASMLGISSTTGAISLTANTTGATDKNITVNDSIDSTSGTVTLLANNNVSFGTDGDVTTDAAVDITATNGAIDMTDGALIDATTGTIKLTATDDIRLGGLKTTSTAQSDAATPAVTVTTLTGDIIDNGDTHLEIDAGLGGAKLTATAGSIGQATGSGATPALEMNVNSINATAGVGDLNIIDTGDIYIDQLTATNGNIYVESTGGSINDLQDDATADLSAPGVGKTITLKAKDEIGGMPFPGVPTAGEQGRLELATGSIVTAKSLTAGDIWLYGAGVLTLTDVSTTDGDINITAAGTITAASVNAAGTDGDVSITTTTGGIVATLITATDDVTLTADAGDITVATITATDDVNLTATTGS